MPRFFFCLASLLALVAVAASAETHRTSAGAVEIERMVGGLDTPWSLAFVPGGGLLITERDGRLLLIADGASREVEGVPDVLAQGQGGLLDVAVARDFAETGTIFLTYSEPASGGAVTALAAARLDQLSARLRDLRVIFRQDGPGRGGRHFGSRVVEAPDGTLYLTVGDRGQRDQVQNPSNHQGKVIRVNRDGTIPADNPWIAGAASGVWSLGHRNPQGAALGPDGALWTVEHGPRGGDEINRPEPGSNYGWPVISYGREYSGGRVGQGTAAPGMEQPLHFWDPSIAPSGMTIYSGRLWSEWRGDIFVGSLKFDFVSRLSDDGGGVAERERLFQGDYGRIRDVREAPDGTIWFLAEADGAAYRMRPAPGS